MRNFWCLFLVGVSAAVGASQANLHAVKQFFDAGCKRNGVVGAALVLMDDCRPVAEEFYGRLSENAPEAVNDHTAFHWASITKTFTGIVIMQLRDRGLLKLDDPIVKYVPEIMAVHDSWGPIQNITIRQLMSHSAGFRNPTWPWGGDKPWHPFEPTQWSQLVAMMPYTEVQFKPGSRYSYSNLGVVFLGQAIQRVTGDDYQIYVEKNILRPLQMYETYFNKSPYFLMKNRSHSYTLQNGHLSENPFDFDTGITVSNGGLNAPMHDMIKYLEFLLDNPASRDIYGQILKRSSLEEMWKPQIKINDKPQPSSNAPDSKDSVGLSFFIRNENGRRYVGHSGGQNGFISHFYLQPEEHRAYIVVFNTNATDANQNTSQFDRELREEVFRDFF